jgi:hypothetical protein
MFSWFSSKVEPLKPLPLSQREKSYSSSTGAVYQYIFKGMAGKSHVFDVSADRSSSFEVRIELPAEALERCAARMGSPLRWNEEYALAKLCLFQAFDSTEQAGELRKPIRPAADQLLEHMNTLNMA